MDILCAVHVLTLMYSGSKKAKNISLTFFLGIKKRVQENKVVKKAQQRRDWKTELALNKCCEVQDLSKRKRRCSMFLLLKVSVHTVQNKPRVGTGSQC